MSKSTNNQVKACGKTFNAGKTDRLHRETTAHNTSIHNGYPSKIRVYYDLAKQEFISKRGGVYEDLTGAKDVDLSFVLVGEYTKQISGASIGRDWKIALSGYLDDIQFAHDMRFKPENTSASVLKRRG